MHRILEETIGADAFRQDVLAELDCGLREKDVRRFQCGWLAQSGSQHWMSPSLRLELLYEVGREPSGGEVRLTLLVSVCRSGSIKLHSKQLRYDTLDWRERPRDSRFRRFTRGDKIRNCKLARCTRLCFPGSAHRFVWSHDVCEQLRGRGASLLVLV